MSIELGWISLFDKCESLGKANARIGILSGLFNAFEFGGNNSKFHILFSRALQTTIYFHYLIFAFSFELCWKSTVYMAEN